MTSKVLNLFQLKRCFFVIFIVPERFIWKLQFIAKMIAYFHASDLDVNVIFMFIDLLVINLIIEIVSGTFEGEEFNVTKVKNFYYFSHGNAILQKANWATPDLFLKLLCPETFFMAFSPTFIALNQFISLFQAIATPRSCLFIPEIVNSYSMIFCIQVSF